MQKYLLLNGYQYDFFNYLFYFSSLITMQHGKHENSLRAVCSQDSVVN